MDSKIAQEEITFKVPEVPPVKASRPVEHIHFDSKWSNKRGSGGLAPSKSTIYISNLPFSLTNNDLHKILEKFGRCIKVSIPRDGEHRSKGIAFAMFLEREPCIRVINAFNGKQLFGRTLKCSIATDNGRTREFIRRKEYPDKSRCYQCGEFGHLSYKCPKNVLGERKRPRKKKKKEKEKEEVDDYYDPDISLAEAIAEDAECCVPEVNPSPEQSCMNPDIPVPSEEPGSSYDIYEGPDGRLFKSSGRDKFVSHQDLPELDVSPSKTVTKRKVGSKRYQPDSYFSDEEVLEED